MIVAMVHNDLGWENSLDAFCLDNNIQGGKKDHFISIYGRVVFDILSSRIYHEFIKKSLWDFYQGSEVDVARLAIYIRNLYHEDLFLVPPQEASDVVPIQELLSSPRFAFKAIGDGKKITKFSLATHEKELQDALGTTQKVVCMFKVPDNLRSLKEEILGYLHRGTKVYQAIEAKVPSSFHVDWERQDNNIYRVINSPFIR